MVARSLAGRWVNEQRSPRAPFYREEEGDWLFTTPKSKLRTTTATAQLRQYRAPHATRVVKKTVTDERASGRSRTRMSSASANSRPLFFTMVECKRPPPLI